MYAIRSYYENEAKIFFNLLFRKPLNLNDSSVPKIISDSSQIIIKNKSSTSIGVRIGRPEKAAARQMKPPTHVLFPISDKGGPTRDLLKASRSTNFFTNIFNRQCPNCNEPSIGIVITSYSIHYTKLYDLFFKTYGNYIGIQPKIKTGQ